MVSPFFLFWRFTMTNVINSTSTAADNCVELPAHLKAKKLVVFYLFFRQ